MNIKDYFNLDYNLEIEEIMMDSRDVIKNSIFFCVKGFKVDSHDFVNQAIENGAICVVHSSPIKQQPGITYIKVDDTISTLNDFCTFFYDDCARKMRVYGVTGTNGKTSISYILHNLVDKCGYCGTLGYSYGEEMNDLYLTTPSIKDLHSIFKKVYDNGCKSIAFEVSSQGLDLHRVDSVDFDTVIFTNLTHDHLDYHKTYENYFQAKARLFEMTKPEGVAVINIDDQYGERLIEKCKCKVVTYAIDKQADYMAEDLQLHPSSSEFTLCHGGEKYHVVTNYIAKFNVYNLLAVIAAMHENGYQMGDIVGKLRNIPCVPGRCMTIDAGQDFHIIVDYAHTPDGIEKMLQYANMVKKENGRVIVVFGLRGSGDEEKRPVSGKIADEYCDEIYITADDNHYEDINSILDGIESGITKHKAHRYELRQDAIAAAIQQCQKDDILCILSKGDEQFNKINGVKQPYEGDDRIAYRVLKEKMKTC